MVRWTNTMLGRAPSRLARDFRRPLASRRRHSLDAASTAELRSERPFGKTIVAYARSHGQNVIEPTSFAHTPGRGTHD
jgi:hypothetical protein